MATEHLRLLEALLPSSSQVVLPLPDAGAFFGWILLQGLHSSLTQADMLPLRLTCKPTDTKGMPLAIFPSGPCDQGTKLYWGTDHVSDSSGDRVLLHHDPGTSALSNQRPAQQLWFALRFPLKPSHVGYTQCELLFDSL